ncbi:hypothetical protein AA313_de0201734 [Arthrobotrys entomopaga]|nr:hypothetical protein AA313_de0201734 [Arthrobotrys entomopaga]
MVKSNQSSILREPTTTAAAAATKPSSSNSNSLPTEKAIRLDTTTTATKANNNTGNKSSEAGGLCYFSVEGVIMVFNPDFNLPDVVSKRSNNEGGSTANAKAPASSTVANIGTTTASSSWFESDSDSPLIKRVVPPLLTKKRSNDYELPLSPKQKNMSSSSNNNNNSNSKSSSLKPSISITPRSSSLRIPPINPPRRSSSMGKTSTEPMAPPARSSSRPNSKVSPFPKRTTTLVRPDRQSSSGGSSSSSLEVVGNTPKINKLSLYPSKHVLDQPVPGTCRPHEPSTSGLSVYEEEQRMSFLSSGVSSANTSASSTVYSSNNSSSSTLKPITPTTPTTPITPASASSLEEAPVINYITTSSRKTRPRLQLRTVRGCEDFGTQLPAIFDAPSELVKDTNSEQIVPQEKESDRIIEEQVTSSISPPATAISAISIASLRTAQEVHIASKLPLQTLLLSPLGAKRAARTTIRPRSPHGISFTPGSGPASIEEETGDEEEATDMVLTNQIVGTVPTTRDHHTSGFSSRSVSRFRRFSLAYLSGTEHDYDAGSEQSSTRSPLRTWKSWSNRSSIVSFSSSNNRNSKNRFSMASVSTSHGSSSGASSSGLDQDDRHRPSLSCSSVAELPWKHIPPQAYAHMMSTRKNSVATTNSTSTQHWQLSQQLLAQSLVTHSASITKEGQADISAAASHSDGSSVRSLNETTYNNETPYIEREDPFTAFYHATKPKTGQEDEIRENEKQKKQEKLLEQIANGGFFDSEDEDEEDEEDLFGRTSATDWWMSGIEEVPEDEEEWDMPRVPSLEFDPPIANNRGSSISTGTTLTADELQHPRTPTATAAEIAHHRKITEMAMTGEPPHALKRRRSRRRTASSECLFINAAEGLRTMYLEDKPDECAVDEDEDGGVLGSRRNTGVLLLEEVKPLRLHAVPIRPPRRS